MEFPLCAGLRARGWYPMGSCTEQALPTAGYSLEMGTESQGAAEESGGVQCPVTQSRKHSPRRQDPWGSKGKPEY